METIAEFFWKYVVMVLEGLFAYDEMTRFQPPAVALGIPLIAIGLMAWWLPRWLFLLVGGLIVIPMMTLLVVCFWLVFVEGYGRRER